MRAAALAPLLAAGVLAAGSVATRVAAAEPPGQAEQPAQPAPPAAVATATLVVEFSGLRSDRGQLHVSLYASEDGFPTEPVKALRQVDVPISGGRARVVLEALAPGGYAVAAYHDENGDGKLDTGFLGIPTEGLGASNDAKGFMGPPSFEKARVDVKAGENRVAVRISY
jgi:uncharacterized protein (DUF2141 family)